MQGQTVSLKGIQSTLLGWRPIVSPATAEPSFVVLDNQVFAPTVLVLFSFASQWENSELCWFNPSVHLEPYLSNKAFSKVPMDAIDAALAEIEIMLKEVNPTIHFEVQ